MDDIIIWTTTISGVAILTLSMLRLRAQRLSRRRLFQDEQTEEANSPPPLEATPAPMDRWLSRWLYVAGYRRRQSVPLFLICVVVALVLGGVSGYFVHGSELLEKGKIWLSEVPGGVGKLFYPAFWLAPWITFVTIASLPWLQVRAARRNLMEEIEQDLPVTAELLATLGEAGLGFDSAVEKILASNQEPRALLNELRMFRRDLLGGLPRITALRRLAARIDIPNMSTVVSGLVQAEQVGAGLANVLRRQADDLRNRRRERAMRIAQTLPVKLTVPLVVCFFPAIVLSVLGPTFHELAQMLEAYFAR